MVKKIAVIIAGVGALVGAALGLFAVPLVQKANASLQPVVDGFYARYNRRDFAGALDEVAPEARAGKTVADLQAHYDRLGAYRGRRTVAFKLKDLRAGRLYLRYRVDYEKGVHYDDFLLRRDGAGYRLEDYPGSCPQN